MKIPNPITMKLSILSLAMGLAFCLPTSGSSQEAAPKPKEKPKPKVVEKAKPKPKVEEKARVKKRVKVRPRSPRLDVPKPPKAPSARDRQARANDRKPNAKHAAKRTTWLGVSMGPVPGSLREHLELAEGFGIQVHSVVANSPAEKAGLQRNDILTRLDDQILTIPEHLSILIRSKKKGDKVTLGLIRKGKSQNVDLVLGENEMPAGPAFGSHHPYRHRVHPTGPHHPHYMHSKEWQEAMKRHQDLRRKMLENHQKQFQSNQKKGNSFKCPLGGQGACPPNKDCPLKKAGSAKGDCPDCNPQRQGGKNNELCPDCKVKQPNAKKEDCKDCEIPKSGPEKKTAKPPAISVRPGFPIKIFGTTGIVKIDNQEGELTLTQEDKVYEITIKDKDGKQVFSGPYNTEKGVKGLPKEAQSQLKKMKLEDLNVILPKAGPKKQEGSSSRKTSAEIL